MYIESPQNQIKGWTGILNDHIGYKNDGFFVEVGAFDGIMWSPSYPLAAAGWSGLFFEPQTEAWEKLLANYKDKAPRIRCIKKAISDFRGTGDLFLGGSLSTISTSTRDIYLGLPGFGSTGLADGSSESVEVSTLNAELATLGAPAGFDVLTIDVEGAEVAVLNGFDASLWKPKLIVIEAHEQLGEPALARKAHVINEYMTSFGYVRIYSDYINNVYVR